jgi:hypothetical protein
MQGCWLCVSECMLFVWVICMLCLQEDTWDSYIESIKYAVTRLREFESSHVGMQVGAGSLCV